MPFWWICFNVLFLDITSGLRNEINGKPLHHHMTKREIERYFGIKDNAEVPEYDIAVPYESNRHGHFVSYQFQEKRSRRDAGSSEDESYYVKMDALGKTMHMKLTRNDEFMAPGLMAETRHADGTITAVPVSEKNFFLGKLTSDASDGDSLVAVSKDKGLTGMIRDKDGVMFIHPLPDHLARHFKTKRDNQPHLIYKGPQDTKREAKCQTPGSANVHKRGVKVQHFNSSKVTHKYLEAAMVADDGTANFHGNGTFRFLLLLGHMLNSIFHDITLGNIKIAYIINRLVIVSLKELGLNSSSSNGQKLGAMAGWSNKHNVKDDSDPMHFDIVSFISRTSGGGLAYLGGVCSSFSNPNVQGDYGLQTVNVIAHETAHNIGIGHDGWRDDCPDGTNVMSTGMTGGPFASKWSSCTREAIQPWLQGPGSSCLDDVPPSSRPKYPAAFHNMLPGQIVNGDKQCKYQNGAKYFRCPWLKSNCNNLYCTSDGGGCFSNMPPPADGTACGPRHWCVSGMCVDNGAPRIHGGWSKWLEYSPCSQSCGGGVKYRERTCTDPSPKNAGENCIGSTKGQWAICNPEACPSEGPSFRDLQCKEKDPKRHAYYVSEPCVLACIYQNSYYRYGWVNDGIRCSRDFSNYDVCIQGKCRSVGCDHQLESGTRKDRCGICGGTGDSCVLVISAYTKNYQKYGFGNPDTIVKLPVGTTGAVFQKRKFTWNFLGVRDKEGNYVINLPTYSRTVEFAGTKIIFRREKSVYNDTLEIVGPTNEVVEIVFAFISGTPGGVDYRYYRPRVPGEQSQSTAFEWKTENWNPCPLKCAAGVRDKEGNYVINLPTYSRTVEFAGTKIIFRREKSVYNDTLEIVGPTNEVVEIVFAFISGTPGGVDYRYYRPRVPGEQSQSTAFEWKTENWNPCPLKCAAGTQTRDVRCIRSDDKTPANSAACDAAVKPTIQRPCNTHPCEPEWHETNWQECSRSCGKGSQARFLLCRRLINQTYYEILTNTSCNATLKPTDRLLFRHCNQMSCPPQWHPLPWSEFSFNGRSDVDSNFPQCSVTCGGGEKTRGVHCMKTNEDGKDVVISNELCKHKASDIPQKERCNDDMPCKPPPETEIGCFNGNPLKEKLGDFTTNLDLENTDAVARQCAQLAHNKGYKHFALGNKGICFSGVKAATEYFTEGGASLSGCMNGIGLANRIFVYALEPLANMEQLGCYYDSTDRALPDHYVSVRDQILWGDPEKTVRQCAYVARDLGYQYFAVQYYGECWAGKNGRNTYSKHGKAPDEDCWKGLVGAGFRNSVYRFI